MPVAIQSCRVCGNSNLVPVLDLGEQYLTGTFPRANDGKNITKQQTEAEQRRVEHGAGRCSAAVYLK
jgi:hypothetical protein